jgi:predicted dehydrogenase
MFGIGVIGLGTMGRRLIGGLKAHPDFTLIAGYDPAPLEIDLPRARSIQELIENPSIDCIYIATPPSTHEDLVRVAAQADKTIFCEKPLAASISSARTCLETVTHLSVPAAVNFPFATSRSAVRLKELVETGALGTDLSAHLKVRFRTWPRGWQHGAATWLAGPEQGGFTREVISHFVFLALRLFGPATLMERSVERGDLGSEVRVHAVLQFAACRLVIDGAVEGDVDDFNSLEVKGSKGSAVMSDWYGLSHESGNIEPTRPDAGQIAELAKFLAGQPNRLATFSEAAHVVGIVEGILAR